MNRTVNLTKRVQELKRPEAYATALLSWLRTGVRADLVIIRGQEELHKNAARNSISRYSGGALNFSITHSVPEGRRS